MAFNSYFLLFLVIVNLGGCFGDSSSISFEDMPKIDGDKIKEKFSKVKTPDDVRQVREWKEKCEEDHGSETVKEIEKAPNDMVQCVMQYVKPEKLQREVNKSIERGNLDNLFKKYCGYREKILVCVDTMLDQFRKCMTPQQLIDVNTTRRAIDAAIDFTCHDDGDRIALFMSEKGVECVKEHKDRIKVCVETKVPEIKRTVDDPDSLELDNVVINEQQCGKILAIHDCIVEATTQCEDPTPANILDALMTQMIKVTPCYRIQQEQSAVRSTASSPHHSSFNGYVKNAIASIGPITYGIFTQLGSFTDTAVPVLYDNIAQLGSVGLALIYVFTAVIQICNSILNVFAVFLGKLFSSVFSLVLSCMGSAQSVVRNSAVYLTCFSEVFSYSGMLVLFLAAVTAANITLL